jgi:hypothetical protein
VIVQLAMGTPGNLRGFEAVLWVRADSPQTLSASLAGIAGALGLPEASVSYPP